jgi:hypothetical protein
MPHSKNSSEQDSKYITDVQYTFQFWPRLRELSELENGPHTELSCIATKMLTEFGICFSFCLVSPE